MLFFFTHANSQVENNEKAIQVALEQLDFAININ
jgi:hypothetical protein